MRALLSAGLSLTGLVLGQDLKLTEESVGWTTRIPSLRSFSHPMGEGARRAGQGRVCPSHGPGSKEGDDERYSSDLEETATLSGGLRLRF
jgi:hypothetical protein